MAASLFELALCLAVLPMRVWAAIVGSGTPGTAFTSSANNVAVSLPLGGTTASGDTIEVVFCAEYDLASWLRYTGRVDDDPEYCGNDWRRSGRGLLQNLFKRHFNSFNLDGDLGPYRQWILLVRDPARLHRDERSDRLGIGMLDDQPQQHQHFRAHDKYHVMHDNGEWRYVDVSRRGEFRCWS